MLAGACAGWSRHGAVKRGRALAPYRRCFADASETVSGAADALPGARPGSRAVARIRRGRAAAPGRRAGSACPSSRACLLLAGLGGDGGHRGDAAVGDTGGSSYAEGRRMAVPVAAASAP